MPSRKQTKTPCEERPAIWLEGVRKEYNLYQSLSDQAIDVLGLGWLQFWRRIKYDTYSALNGVDLVVRHGERVGMIGRNGAGKTTLLKLIIGNVSPSSGKLVVDGSVQALMHIGLGFHNEFTGDENIRASLMFNGLESEQLESAFNDVVSFAELDQFINQPLKTYSGVFALRRRIDSFLTLPVTFFALVILTDLVLLGLGLADRLGGREGWYLEGVSDVRFWVPAQAVLEYGIEWGALARSAAEIGAVCGVTALSVLLDVSSLEVARQQSADLDKELKYNGVANILSGLAGGAAGNLSLSGSILIQEAGAVSRFSGVAASGFCAIVLFAGTDIAAYIPTPLLGGLLAYLGLVVLSEALIRLPAQRSETEFILSGAIMAVIVYSGYLLGVVLGIVGACLLFAINYSRIGVVRRHVTRLDFSSNVERSPHETALLKEHGAQIHLLWLSGFIFFGSSNGLFEFIKRVMDKQVSPRVRFLALDFSTVPGLDTSAVLSLVKLRNYCDERAAHIAFAGLNDQLDKIFTTAGIISRNGPHRAFPDRNEALEWCENQLLSEHESAEASEETFEHWLKNVFGGEFDTGRLMSYFNRRKFKEGQVVLKQGGQSNSVDLLAAGSIAITIAGDQGQIIRLRSMAAQTVIGEMGFFRKAPRVAGVVAEQSSVIYRLTRKNFERMQAEDPKAAAAFYRLIVRLLSDRLEFANREISVLV